MGFVPPACTHLSEPLMLTRLGILSIDDKTTQTRGKAAVSAGWRANFRSIHSLFLISYALDG